MSKRIQVLPESITQIIAAGEVVERPASVVKELMENAIDAGSSEILVELKAGGLQLIRVVDNGEGIDPEDVPLAIQRYATSKIQKEEDLYTLHTLGFRGEALPSIASVSQMTIRTRVAGHLSGTKAICEGGQVRSISEVGCPIGTEVEVRNIFFNIPVKRKFLKSIRSELRHVLSLFLKLSLAHPSISFKFIHDGRMLYEWLKTESSLVRIESILGGEIIRHLQPIAFEDGEIRISGFASRPSFSKGNPDGIYLYANQRFIKDRMIYKAIIETYRHIIPAGKFPVVILLIKLPPSAIDVNVHPTKTEVKFRDPEKIFQAVFNVIRMMMEERPGQLEELPAWNVKTESLVHEEIQPSFLFQESRRTYFPEVTERDGGPIPMVKEDRDRDFQWKAEIKPSFQILGQIRGTFILCEGERQLIFIDQHAAHERILFEKFKNQYETKAILSERYLTPLTMELSIEESFMIDSHLEEFQSIGFEIDPIGERIYAIRSVPTFADEQDTKEMIRKILDDLSFLKKGGKGTEAINTILITLACHSAIRGNFTLRREEMEKLVEDLIPFNLSTTCPHGRPIFFSFSLDELNKQFKRN